MTPNGSTPTRRTVLRGIGASGALLAGGVGLGSAQSDSAQIRVAHLSPDAGDGVDVTLSGPVSTTVTVDYRDVTDYLAVPAGTYTVSAAGVSVEVELEADEYYTGAAIGSALGQGESFRLALYEDNAGAVPKASRVRLVHASPDAPKVDVTVESTGDVLFRNVAFGESGGYSRVPAGDYTLEVRVATNGRPGTGPVAATFDVSVPAGVNATVYAVNFLADLDLQVVLDG